MSVVLNANDVLEYTLYGQYLGQVSQMKLHYLVTLVGAPGPTDRDVVAALDTVFAPKLIALMTNNALYAGSGIQRVFPTPKPIPQYVVTNAGNGTAGTAPLPTQTRGVITWLDGLAGVAHRGRSYTPFPDHADDNGSAAPSAGYATRLGLFAAIYLAVRTVTASGGNVTVAPIIYHRKTHTNNLITGAIDRTKWATQRRSGAYGRPNVLPF